MISVPPHHSHFNPFISFLTSSSEKSKSVQMTGNSRLRSIELAPNDIYRSIILRRYLILNGACPEFSLPIACANSLLRSSYRNLRLMSIHAVLALPKIAHNTGLTIISLAASSFLSFSSSRVLAILDFFIASLVREASSAAQEAFRASNSACKSVHCWVSDAPCAAYYGIPI